MKLTCLQKNLSEALTKVYRAVPTKSELPILANILISAKDNQLKLSATNLATTIVTYTGADVAREGSITIPAKLLKDFIANITPGNLELELEKDILHITSDTTKTKFNGITAEDYPDLPESFENVKFFDLNTTEFTKAISKVGFSAATDESRPIFTGIFLKFEDDTLTIASSDGFRLSEVKLKLKEKIEQPVSVILPAKTVMELARVFSNEVETLQFGIDENDNLAIFKQKDTLVVTRILEGTYPDYNKIVPAEGKVKVEFAASELLEAVKLTNIFAKEGDSAIVLEIEPEGKIGLRAIAEEMGEHKGAINANIEADENMTVGFNSKYLMDFLVNIGGETIIATTNGSTAPCVFRIIDTADHFHIIMPIQLNNK